MLTIFMAYQRTLFLLVFALSLVSLGSLHAEARSMGEDEPLTVYLTWMRSPESTMTICWITYPEETEDEICYCQEGNNVWAKLNAAHTLLPGHPSFLLHKIELTNLEPETTYLFRTGKSKELYKFSTMPTTLQKPIRFVAGGDMYHDTLEILSATNQQAAKTNPHFALVGGDIAYAVDTKTSLLPKWTQSFIDFLAGQKIDRWLTWLIAWKNDMVTSDRRLIPILPIIGNHDTNGRFNQTPEQAPFFYALFPMPGKQGCNVLDFGNYLSVILLDSGHTHSISGQTPWLLKTLEERTQVPHKFAIYHVPAYPSVRPYNNEISVQIRKFWVPIFDQYHLTAAFENHDHDYKRTFPLINSQPTPNGVMYFGDGAWGVENPRKSPKYPAKPYLAKTAQKRHFILITLKEDQRHAYAITPQGDLIDQYTW